MENKTFEDEDFLNKTVALLAKDQNENVDDLLHRAEDYYGSDGGMILNRRWVIFPNEEVAENTALDQVREDLENEPGLFNQDWLMNIIDVDAVKVYFDFVYREWDESYIEDIRDEEGRLEDEMTTWQVDTEEDLVDAMVKDKLGDDGGLGYYRDNFGEEETNKLIIENNFIDIEDAAKEAIATDGWPHFISRYDGNFNELDNGVVYFRE